MNGKILQTNNYLIHNFFSLKGLIRVSGQQIILPFYHAVSDRQLPHLNHLYHVRSIKKFKRDLEFYLKYYTPVSEARLSDHITGKTAISGNAFFISFDDGLSECYDIIAPVLLEKGIPATFFINSAFVDNKDMMFRFKVSLLLNRLTDASCWEVVTNELLEQKGYQFSRVSDLFGYIKGMDYSDTKLLEDLAEKTGFDYKEYLAENKPYMTLEQIRDLQRKGFSIGAHSVDHPRYSQLSYDEMYRQTLDCLNFLKKNGVEAGTFSFPFTDVGVSKEYFNKISQHIHLSFGGSGLKSDVIPFNLHRIPMEDSGLPASVRVKNEYIYYILKSLVNKNTINRN